MSHLFGPTRQLGMVVRDIDAAMRTMSERLGVGPFYLMREIRPEIFRYRGQDSPPPLLSLAFAFTGPLQIELIQQHDDHPSIYLEFLARGREGAQHLSAWTSQPEEYDQARAQGLKSGAAIIQEGQIGPGRFIYFDTVDPAIGLCFEIAEALHPLFLPHAKGMQATAATWDGSRPVRDFQAAADEAAALGL